MDTYELKKKLDTLYDDLMIADHATSELMEFICSSGEDKRKLLNEVYFKDNAPVKVIGTEFLGRKEADITGEMLNVSIKYDEFIHRLHREADQIMTRHVEAVDIFNLILSLPEPYCRILYLRYFKRLSCQETMQSLYLSRTTFFRTYNKALMMLQKELEN